MTNLSKDWKGMRLDENHIRDKKYLQNLSK